MDRAVEIVIPRALAATRRAMHGLAGETWVAALPRLVAACRERWELTIGEPFPGASYNWVAPVRRADGVAAVLKVCYPDREFLTEVEALAAFGGNGCVALLAADPAAGALLIEQADPGFAIATLAHDDEATSAAITVMRALPRSTAAPGVFPTVADWGGGFARLRARFGGGSGPFPPPLVDEAEDRFATLLASSSEAVLLHGDLHHGNIVSAKRRPWLAIDPKGVLGEPAYEVGALLRNPVPAIAARPDAARLLARRVDLLAAELGYDRERMRGWGMSQAVLAAWWSLEDGIDGWAPFMRCAELLRG